MEVKKSWSLNPGSKIHSVFEKYPVMYICSMHIRDYDEAPLSRFPPQFSEPHSKVGFVPKALLKGQKLSYAKNILYQMFQGAKVF